MVMERGQGRPDEFMVTHEIKDQQDVRGAAHALVGRPAAFKVTRRRPTFR